jgi:hypothetical protein
MSDTPKTDWSETLETIAHRAEHRANQLESELAAAQEDVLNLTQDSEDNYRQGIKRGMELAAQVCERLCNGNARDEQHFEECAAAIRERARK